MTFYVLLGCGNAVEKTVTIAVIHGYLGGMQDVDSYALVVDCAHRVTTLLSLGTNGVPLPLRTSGGYLRLRTLRPSQCLNGSSPYSLAPLGAPCLMPLLRGCIDLSS